MTTYRVTAGINDIQPSPTNPRKSFPEESLAELAASIKAVGIAQPLVLRTNPCTDEGAPHYELIFGERRWRAAKLAGLETVPGDVRDDLSTAQIIELQIIENLQREDLHPLDEAEGYEKLMHEYGHSAEQLAEQIGKSRSYIFSRLKLLALDEDARRFFRSGLLNPSTALLVARIPSAALRSKAIADITRTDWNNEIMSVRRAQRHIRERYMLRLKDASFPTEDGELIATAGPCAACPKRTGNNPDLFDDIEDADVCTDPDCFTAKKLAAAERRAKEIGPDVKVVTGEEAEKILPRYSSESKTHVKLDSKCFDDPEHRTYREIIGDDNDAITLIAHPEKGELVPVVAKKVIAEKLKAAGVVTQAQKTRDDNKKTRAKVALENAWRDKLFRKIRESQPGKSPKIPVLECLVAIVTRRFLIDAGHSRAENVAGLWGAIGANSFDRAESFRNGLANYTVEELLGICLDLALLAEHQTDEYNLQRKPEGILAMAEALEIDAAALLAEAKAEQKPPAKAKKTPKNASPATSEDHSYPSEAAQAQDFTRANDGGATEAAPAGGDMANENAEAATGEEEQSSGSIEPNEKPTWEQPAFQVGDRVRVLDIPDPRYGLKSALAGQEGIISTYFYNPIEFGVTIDGGESMFIAEMLELVSKASEFEMNEKPTAGRRSGAHLKYQHPDYPDCQWSGRGRKPKWVENWLQTEGNTLADLEIEGAAA